MKGFIFTSIIALFLLAIGGFGLIWMLYSILNILSIVATIVIWILSVKFLSDFLFQQFKVSISISIFLGILGSIPIVIVVYQNSMALVFGAMILGAIYLIGFGVFRDTAFGSASSLKQWFKGRKGRKK